MPRSGAILVWAAFALATAAVALDSFHLKDIEVSAGELKSGYVRLPVEGLAGAENIPDLWTHIPVSIAHGAHPGPTLVLIAGIHGTEYPPIEALQRLRDSIDTISLHGTVVMVHIANPPSFYARTSFKSPDGLNLNRSFPGKANGVLTERIAHVLVNDIISRADAVIDIHCGDGDSDMIPWVGYYAKLGSPDVIEKSRNMAHAFGIPLIVPFEFQLEDGKTTFTGPNALVRNIPAFDVECGRWREVEEEFVQQIFDGVHNVMWHLGMLSEQPVSAKQEPAPEYVLDRTWMRTKHSGLYYKAPGLKAGDRIRKGSRIGCIKDAFGRILQEFIAERDGLLLLVHSGKGLAVQEDELAVIIAYFEADLIPPSDADTVSPIEWKLHG